MPDTIGRIQVPDPFDSGLTFPLVSDYGFGSTQDRPIVIHQFGELDAKAEQRFATGIGPRKHQFRRALLNLADRNRLAAFWESMQGAWKTFTYNVPNADGSFTATKVAFEYAPLSLQYLQHACQVGLTFIEVPDPANAPAYSVTATCLRFPSTALQNNAAEPGPADRAAGPHPRA